MKVKIIKKFFDKASKKLRLYGDVIEIDNNRYQELKDVCEKIFDKEFINSQQNKNRENN